MTRNKKFRIPGLNINSKYKSAAPIVLSEKIKHIYKEIDKFFINDSSENLHSLRIAFRRFRYVMEIFQECIDPKFFNYIYNHAKKMQDLIGEGRDLDVMEIKFRQLQKELKKRIPENIFEKLAEEKVKIRRVIKTELINFIIDKDFNKLLNNK